MINDELKLKVIKIYLWIVGIFLFFWWPLSHWFFSDLYQTLLGFPKSSYQENMIKIIGTLGIIPVLMSILSAINPINNKNMVIILII